MHKKNTAMNKTNTLRVKSGGLVNFSKELWVFLRIYDVDYLAFITKIHEIGQ